MKNYHRFNPFAPVGIDSHMRQTAVDRGQLILLSQGIWSPVVREFTKFPLYATRSAIDLIDQVANDHHDGYGADEQSEAFYATNRFAVELSGCLQKIKKLIDQEPDQMPVVSFDLPEGTRTLCLQMDIDDGQPVLTLMLTDED